MGRRGRDDAPPPTEKPGRVPESFARFFRGLKDEQLGQALRDYLNEEYGSEHAYLFWLAELATKADRDTVRMDATAKVIQLLHGDAPAIVEVRTKDDERSAPPAPSRERLAAVAGILQQMGGLPQPRAAMLPRGSTHAEVEQVPSAPKRREGV